MMRMGKTRMKVSDLFRRRHPVKIPTNKPIEVHLGNTGYFRTALQTRREAKRFPEKVFVGIDLHRPLFVRNQWLQIKADFVDGLRQLEDSSVSRITSCMALGSYTKRGWFFNQRRVYQHTQEAVNLAHQKLKPNGTLEVVESAGTVKNIKEILQKSNFKKIEIRELSPNEISTISAWTANSTTQTFYVVKAIK